MNSMMKLLLATLIIFVFASVGQGQTSYPMITHAYPTAIQKGKTSEVVVEGQQNFLGAYKVLVEGDGVTAEIVAVEPPKTQPPQKPMVRTVKVKFTVPDGALPGIR